MPRPLISRLRHELTHDPLRHFEPRSRTHAGRSLVLIILAAAVVTLVFGFSPNPLDRAYAYIVPTTLFALAALLRWRVPPMRSPVWIGIPLFGVALVLVLDLVTRDASAGAQVFLCFPVLFAASQLRTPAAWIVASAAILTDVTVAFTLLPFDSALIDAVYVSATLLTMTALLARAGDRQERLVKQLRELATVDPLTGLVTRRVFDEVARAALAERSHEPGTALVLVDLDRFKEINDTYGHPVGDDALVHIATVLGDNVRPTSVISRIGGDEIAVLMPDCDLRAALDRAQQIVTAVHDRPLSLQDGTHLKVSISAGVAHSPEDGVDLRALYAAADASLYLAKRHGRDRVGVV